ncbi:MAG TPA: AAA family ATPase [bacterium]|nr:AAA family ATPase [bacterium]
MSKPLLIIISGLPCTGKTTLGRKIAEKFCLPFFSKDDIKESLFDDLGWSDRIWSKKLSRASLNLIYYISKTLLLSKSSLIIEGNFRPETENERFLNLMSKFDFEPLQIICKANGEILFQRFKDRWKSGRRHPGHVDDSTSDELKSELLKGRIDNLNIGGKVFDIDTTDFNTIDYDKLFSAIKSATNR